MAASSRPGSAQSMPCHSRRPGESRDPFVSRWKRMDGSRPWPGSRLGVARWWSLHVEAVELGDVAAGDLEHLLGARILEVARDDLLRMRPGRGLVRVIRGPHHPIDTDKPAALYPDIIVDVCRPHLPPEILARLQLHREAGGGARALGDPIHPLQVIGDPAGGGLCR